jgi:hypothetical protein
MFIGQDGKRRRICADSRRRQHLALLASLISIRVTISVALTEIVVGAFAGN